MSTVSKECKEFQLAKSKICRLKTDIFFLTRCKKCNILPSFTKINSKTRSESGILAIKKARRAWLNIELKHHYSKLAKLNLVTYDLYQKLTKAMSFTDLSSFMDSIDFEYKTNVKTLLIHKRKKLRDLKQSQCSDFANHITSEFIPDFVVNKSNVQLNDDEINLLNKGLNFALPNKETPKKDIIVDTEIAAKYVNYESANLLRAGVKNILSKPKASKITANAKTMFGAIKSLNEKEVYVMKADKGNGVVVVDRSDYDAAIQQMIDDGPYSEVKNPSGRMTTACQRIAEKHKETFGGDRWKRSMLPSYAKVPRIYGLPKIHKTGNSYRPIVSKINSQFYNMSKWLVGRFASLKSFDNFSIKNAIQLTEKLCNVKLAETEVLVSFDIASYFTSVPVEKSLDCLQNWLDRQHLDHIESDALFELTKVCAENSFFQFRDKYYKQTSGMAMGDCLSPFLCNLFVNDLENELSKNALFPKTWWRYVDDVIAVIERDKLDDILALINGISPNIKFTVEMEHNGKLPFLDLYIERNPNGSIAFDIYRKPTSTERYITNESNHHPTHKLAAFNCMAHRLCNVPLSKEKFVIEKQRIHHIASLNGYKSARIDWLINKHKRSAEIKNVSSLLPLTENKKRCSMLYHQPYHNDISKCFAKVDLLVAPKSNNKVNSLLKSSKDFVPLINRPGIYIAKCETENCDACYVGQTRRELKVRGNEHLKCYENNTPSRSAIAEHALDADHHFTLDSFTLIENEQHANRLNVLESIHIHLNRDNALNRDDGPHLSPLYKLL